MSGGSYNYTYSQVQDMAEELQRSRNPMRRTFGNHLLKVAEALHDIEWVDSGDYGDGDDLKAIQAVLGELNAIGFDIELEQKPKLTKREYDFLKNFKDTIFYRDGDGDLACSNKIPSTIDGFNMSDSTSIFLDNTLLEFIGSGREHVWSVEDLLELEVQND